MELIFGFQSNMIYSTLRETSINVEQIAQTLLIYWTDDCRSTSAKPAGKRCQKKEHSQTLMGLNELQNKITTIILYIFNFQVTDPSTDTSRNTRLIQNRTEPLRYKQMLT